MTTQSDELRRLLSGPAPDEEPAGIGTVTLVGLCRRDASRVAQRCREVLGTVLGPEFDAKAPRPEQEAKLPRWFVDACAPEMSPDEFQNWHQEWQAMTPEQQQAAEEGQPWALLDWLHWFQPHERHWSLWECTSDKSTVRIVLEVQEWPVAQGALVWLLRAAGAEQIVTEET